MSSDSSTLQVVERIAVTTRIVSAQIRPEHREALDSQATSFGTLLRDIDPDGPATGDRIETFRSIGETLLPDRDTAVRLVRDRLEKSLKSGVLDPASAVQGSMVTLLSLTESLSPDAFGSLDGVRKVLGVPMGRRIDQYLKSVYKSLPSMKAGVKDLEQATTTITAVIELIEGDRATVWVTIEKFAQLDYLFDLLFADTDAVKASMSSRAAAYIDEHVMPIVADRHALLSDARGDVAQAYLCLDLLRDGLASLKAPLLVARDAVADALTSIAQLADSAAASTTAASADGDRASGGELAAALLRAKAMVGVASGDVAAVRGLVMQSLTNLPTIAAVVE